MNKRLLVPRFLQELDDKLLRNKPGTWAARTHLVVYFTVLFALLTAAFCYFVFFDAKQDSSIISWNVFVGLIAFIGFVFWLIFLLRFNVFKRYGNWFAMDSLKDFALYFIAIGAMTGVCFVPSAVETYRANQQFGNEEIVNDINELNVSACKLEYGLLPLTWTPDTFRVVPKLPNRPVNEETTVVVATDTVLSEEPGHISYKYELIDTAELRVKIMNADSLLKLNDTMYVFYDCPDYTFVSARADEYTTTKLLYSADIYYSTIKNYRQPDKAALLKRMEALKIKYAFDSRNYYGDYYDNNNSSYTSRIIKKYDLSGINSGIDNVVMKKYDWVKNWNDYLRVFYYITLLFTLLVFIFRHSTVKTFFLSVLTGVLLSIITALIMAVSDGSGSSILSFMIFYYAVFIVLALSILGVRVRKAVQGIGLNLFVFMTPFIPWIFVQLNRSMKERRYYEEEDMLLYKTVNWSLYFLLAEIAGALILLILVHTLFKKLYRRWYSAPEE